MTDVMPKEEGEEVLLVSSFSSVLSTASCGGGGDHKWTRDMFSFLTVMVMVMISRGGGRHPTNGHDWRFNT